VATCYGFGNFARSRFSLCAANFDFDDALRAFAVGYDLAGERAAHIFKSRRNWRCALLPPEIEGAPAAPLARTSNVSLVEVSPVNADGIERCATRHRAMSAAEGKGKLRQSVDDERQRGRHVGMNHARAFAHPTKWMRSPDILKVADAVFGRVSVVQMASESSANDRADARRLRASDGRARRIFSTGSCTAITPVEQTHNSAGVSDMRRAASSLVRCATASP